MKKAEKERIIRGTANRRCRGPQSGLGDVLKQLERTKASAEVAAKRGNEAQAEIADQAQADIDRITEVAESLDSKEPTVRQVCTALLEAGDNRLAAQVDRAARKGCGYDINDLILAHPLDGLPKAEECPECGTVISWTPVDYDSMDEVPEGLAHLFEEDED